ncbi:MAG TPA: hypothetical protein VM553_01530 [Dongiaceae bacterium]|nr:hypothetical protein [Dongiaceae bacterium]
MSGDELQYLGSANTAQPFWEILGQFFRYPFKPDCLMMIGIFVVASWGVLSVADGTGIVFMLIGALVILACITRFGFLVLEYTSEGREEPPTLNETLANTGFEALFQQIVVQVIFVVFLVLVGRLGSTFLNIIALSLVVFVTPASLMILATEKSISLAVSPSSISHLIRSVGWSYLLLYAFLFLLWGAEAAMFEVFAEEIAPQYFLPAFIGMTLYFMVVAYNLMGYVIFQYQSEIGFVAEDAVAREKRRSSIDPLDSKVEVLVKEGRYEKAVETLSKHLRAQPGSVRHHDKLSRLLIAMDDREQALAHSQAYMDAVHKLGDESRLYFLYNDYEKLDPKFLPETPAICLTLAHQLYRRGKFNPTCHLLANMHKRAPNFGDIPEAYLLIARALFDGLKDSHKASQYLKFIKAKYPDYKEMQQVDALLAECSR